MTVVQVHTYGHSPGHSTSGCYNVVLVFSDSPRKISGDGRFAEQKLYSAAWKKWSVTNEVGTLT